MVEKTPPNCADCPVGVWLKDTGWCHHERFGWSFLGKNKSDYTEKAPPEWCPTRDKEIEAALPVGVPMTCVECEHRLYSELRGGPFPYCAKVPREGVRSTGVAFLSTPEGDSYKRTPKWCPLREQRNRTTQVVDSVPDTCGGCAHTGERIQKICTHAALEIKEVIDVTSVSEPHYWCPLVLQEARKQMRQGAVPRICGECDIVAFSEYAEDEGGDVYFCNSRFATDNTGGDKLVANMGKPPAWCPYRGGDLYDTFKCG